MTKILEVLRTVAVTVAHGSSCPCHTTRYVPVTVCYVGGVSRCPFARVHIHVRMCQYDAIMHVFTDGLDHQQLMEILMVPITLFYSILSHALCFSFQATWSEGLSSTAHRSPRMSSPGVAPSGIAAAAAVSGSDGPGRAPAWLAQQPALAEAYLKVLYVCRGLSEMMS